MKPFSISLSWSQEPVTCSYPEPDISSPRYTIIFIHFNIIILSMPSLANGLFARDLPTKRKSLQH
jgi:hypothetical protein